MQISSFVFQCSTVNGGVGASGASAHTPVEKQEPSRENGTVMLRSHNMEVYLVKGRILKNVHVMTNHVQVKLFVVAQISDKYIFSE